MFKNMLSVYEQHYNECGIRGFLGEVFRAFKTEWFSYRLQNKQRKCP